jgi:NADH:ubiquinone oxidoreductase subunit 6 (subunit J)
MRRGVPTWLRAAIVAVIVALLAVVVALAGSGGAVAGEPSSEGASTVLIDLLLVVVAVLCVVLWILLLPMVLIERRKQAEGKGRASFQQRVAAGAIAIVLVFTVVVLVVRAREEQGQQDIVGSLTPPPAAKGKDPGIEPDHASTSQMATAAAITLLVCGAGVYVLLRTRRRPMRERTAREQIAIALDEAVDDLRAELDPRRAVVAAYARMERTMALYGAPREPWEAPNEYLARTLGELGVGPSAGELTGLFEQARFSEHAITETEREAAIDALLAVRDDLRAADARMVAA